MRIRFFFPIIDFRSFVNTDTHKINSPTWPYPTPNSDFIRNFGQIKSKIDWNQERFLYFCDARNSIKFVDFYKINDISIENKFKKCYTLKNIYVNNQIESIFEISFNFVPENEGVNVVSIKNLFSLLKEIFNLQVKFNSLSKEGNKDIFKLKDLGKALSKLYLHSTTKSEELNGIEDWWVSTGHPMLLIEIDYNKMPFREQETKVFEFTSSNLLVSHIFFKDKAYICSLWGIYKKDKNKNIDKNICTKLVQNIMNTHSEYEGIKQVLKLVIKKKLTIKIGSKAADSFQNYLNRTITKLTAEKRDSIPQKNIFKKTSIDLKNFISSEERIKLLNECLKIRPNVLRKTVNFLENGTGESPPLDSLNIGIKEKEIFKYIKMEEFRKKIFISYSHKDKEWLKRLIVHFKPIARNGLIDLWSDEKIQIGQLWKDEIDKALRESKIVILLVTADFLESDFIYDNELPILLDRAQNKGATIIPLIIAPSFFTNMPELSKFKAFNNPKTPLLSMNKYEQEEILANLASTVFDFLNLDLKSDKPNETNQSSISSKNQTPNDINVTIISFIKQNQIEPALDFLLEYYKKIDKIKHRDIILLIQRWNENIRRTNLNLVSNEEYNLERTKIINSILNFLP